MKVIRLDDSQLDAVERMKDGCILCGKVGSGKSRTALAYYYKEYGGDLYSGKQNLMTDPPDLYIITTAKKRDSFEWEEEMSPFLLGVTPESNFYSNKVTVDSWNKIQNYTGVTDSFFIFDEQRVVGYGAWSKAFLEICKHNRWILLSATPGDKWEDYIPVFMANGFYKTKTEFAKRHIVYRYHPGIKFPQVDRYLETMRLARLRDQILVTMDTQMHTVQHHEDVIVDYDKEAYYYATKMRWSPYTNDAIMSASEYCYTLRQIVNSDESRQAKVLELLEDRPRAIIFYNFDYELEILRNLAYINGTVIAEWNGHNHQPVPETDRWVYLVQYYAGAEGWNCIKTNTIIFYSQSYSYKTTEQASGRINRRNTPFVDLYYYHLKSKAGIDLAIARALRAKKEFNIKGFTRGLTFERERSYVKTKEEEQMEEKRYSEVFAV